MAGSISVMEGAQRDPPFPLNRARAGHRMGRGVRVAGEVDADDCEVDAMKTFKPVTCPNCRSVAVGDYGVKINPRFECIDCGTKIDGYYDPFQDALPCWDHQERPNQIFPLASLADLTDEGLRALMVRLEDEIEERGRLKLDEDSV